MSDKQKVAAVEKLLKNTNVMGGLERRFVREVKEILNDNQECTCEAKERLEAAKKKTLFEWISHFPDCPMYRPSKELPSVRIGKIMKKTGDGTYDSSYEPLAKGILDFLDEQHKERYGD